MVMCVCSLSVLFLVDMVRDLAVRDVLQETAPVCVCGERESTYIFCYFSIFLWCEPVSAQRNWLLTGLDSRHGLG